MRAYLLTWMGAEIPYQQPKVHFFETRTQAQSAADDPEINAHKAHNTLVIEEESDLQQFAMAELCGIYEAITGTAVNRFRDLETGKKRILVALKAQSDTNKRDEGLPEEPVADDQQKEGEDVTTSKTKKPTKKKAAVAKPVKAAKPVKVAKVAKAKGDGSKARVDRDAKIQIINPNPRRAGTAAFDSYELMKNGMKVGTFIEKGGRMQDFRYDLKHGHIKLVKE